MAELQRGIVVRSFIAAFQWIAGIVMIGGLAIMVLCYAICSLGWNFPRTVDGIFGQLMRLKSPVSIRELVDGAYRRGSHHVS